MSFDPKTKIQYLRNPDEKRAILALLDIIDDVFGFNFIISDGFVVEIQMVATALTSIPRTLGEFPNLYKLQLQENKIRRIRNLGRCKSLRILNLNNNLLESESLSVIEQLNSLESLDLSHNKLNDLDLLNTCSNLSSLNVANNQISRIPPLPGLARLMYLDLTENPIVKLENLHNFEKLIQVKLSKANLSVNEEEIFIQGIHAIKEYCAKNR